AHPHGVGPQVRIDHRAIEPRWEQTLLVDYEPAGQRAAQEPMVPDGVEVSEGVGIVQRAVLAEPLDVVCSLDVVAERLRRVAAGEKLAVPVEIDSPGIAAALREKLELPRARMVSPHPLLELDAADIRRYRAALRSVQPAVRPPGQ